MPKSGEPKKSETKKEETKSLVEPKSKKKIDIEPNQKEDKTSSKMVKKETKSTKDKKADDNKIEKKKKSELKNEKKRSTESSFEKKDSVSKKEPKKPVEKSKKEVVEKENRTKPKTKEEKKVIENKTIPFVETVDEKQEVTEKVGKSSADEIESQSLPIGSMINGTKVSKHNNFKNREFHTLEVVILIVLTCVISLAVGSLLGIRFKEKNIVHENVEVAGEAIQNFLKDYNYLIENYYGEIDEKELLNTAFKSMVDSLGDSYSGAIDESTSNNFDIELKGDYEGLGIEIINDSEKNILIYSIIPNSPASKTDIKVGDKLLTVNNIDVRGMTTTDFIKNIVKGSGASEFLMVFEREGAEYSVTVKKEAITLESVTSKVYQENGKRIAYIKVSIFAENTYDQFKNELARLESEGFESLIIDLRDNSGGHLTTVKNMISLFLDSSHVIYQTEDKKGRKKVYSTGKETKKYPIVIVGNAMSASASEVMIGALTEEYGAILIGNQTFGKGTVQELHSLINGDEYKFTTKKWLTPKGNWVHNNGIQPKIEVTLSREYYGNPTEENDNQLKAAIDYLAGMQ